MRISCTRRRRSRRGVAVSQWAVVAVLILLAIVATVSSVGTTVNDELEVTSTNVGDPSTLPSRFGSGS